MASWSVTAARDLPLDNSDTWDGGAAAASIFEWAGGDSFDPAKAKRGFCFQDTSAPDLRGSYKDPFAHVVSGTLKAVKGGVDAAARRIQDTNGPSADQKASALTIMEDYQDRFGETADDTPDSDADDAKSREQMALWRPPEGHFWTTRAQVLGDGVPQSSLDGYLQMIHDRAPDPGVFDTHPPYLWRAQVSNQQLDSYGTKMHDSSLRNYAEDAKAGVAFQNSHKHDELPMGTSIDGQYKDGRTSGGKHTEATFFTMPDLNLNGVNTNDLIRGMQSGIVHDVSIAFHGEQMTCSVCDRDIWDLDCNHVPFLFFGTNAVGDGAEPAFVWVRGAHMSETSACYDGATPGAGVMKARREAALGRLNPEALRLLETRYRMRLPAAPARRFAGASLREVRAMGEENTEATTEGTRATATTAGIQSIPGAPSTENLRAAIAQAGGDPTLDVLDAIRALGDERARLVPLADDGRAYRADLIDEALAEGIRAHGNEFASEEYKALLSASPIATIKRMRDDWKRTANGFFAANGTNAGGRQTDLGREPEPKRERELPERLFAI